VVHGSVKIYLLQNGKLSSKCNIINVKLFHFDDISDSNDDKSQQSTPNEIYYEIFPLKIIIRHSAGPTKLGALGKTLE